MQIIKRLFVYAMIVFKSRYTKNHEYSYVSRFIFMSHKMFFIVPCLEYRIIMAINDHTEQLEYETNTYIRSVEEEQDKHRRLHKALSINAGIMNDSKSSSSNDINDKELVRSTIQSFEHELMTIKQACREHDSELNNLNQLLMEQAHVSSSLSLQENELLLEFNSIEKEAKVFEDMHRQLTQQCHSAEIERSHLNHVRLHTSLFDIVVDTKGELYPLINNLRLSHRPKGDLQWTEINTAWSQATQLLMFMSNTVKFVSRNYGIIPLMHCAKIIEIDSNGKKVYHHLGVDFQTMDKKTHNTDHITTSLQVFFTLLYQLSIHIKISSDHEINWSIVPYDMTKDSIGPYNIRMIEENDETSWRGAINSIASNLRWLSTVL